MAIAIIITDKLQLIMFIITLWSLIPAPLDSQNHTTIRERNRATGAYYSNTFKKSHTQVIRYFYTLPLYLYCSQEPVEDGPGQEAESEGQEVVQKKSRDLLINMWRLVN